LVRHHWFPTDVELGVEVVVEVVDVVVEDVVVVVDEVEADIVMKSRVHHEAKYLPVVPVIPDRRRFPFEGEARPFEDDGEYVTKLTQSVLMSSSIARTAPARTNRFAKSVMFKPGPAT
jgi:hypothetical protein